MKSLSTHDISALSFDTLFLQVDEPQAAPDSSVPVGGEAIVPPMERVPGSGSLSASGALSKKLWAAFNSARMERTVESYAGMFDRRVDFH